jgi:type I restriction enzyme S subunit
MKNPIAISVEPRCFSDDEVPEGWKLVTILDACEINPPKPPKNFLPADAPVTFVPMPAVDADMGAITNPQIKPYLEVRNGFTSFRDGDVIMAKITPCMENGKAAIVHGMKNGIGFGSTEFHVMRSRGEILPEYLYYYIRQKSFRNEAESHFTGSVGQKRVPTDFIKQSVIPLPPLAEQQRIVARVEALLSHVDAAGDRLSRVPAIMKKFRQSVLAAACSGRLTEEWREENPDIETAEITLEQIQTLKNNSNLRKNKSKKKIIPTNFENDNELQSDIVADLPPTWTISNLENITSRITSGSRWWKKYYCNDGPGTFILSQNVRPFYLNWSTVLHVDPPENDPDRKRSEVQKDDLLITIAGNTGDVCRVREDIPQHYVCQSVAMVRPVLKEISPYLEVCLNSPSHGQKQFDDWAYGEGRPHLSFDQLKKTTVLLPPLAEQREIVRRVGLLFERADAIEREVAAAGRRCEQLTQAVMVKAFSGML